MANSGLTQFNNDMPNTIPLTRLFLLLVLLPLNSLSLLASHPRLFFDAADIPALRERAQREPYASMLQKVIDGGEAVLDSNPAYNLGFQARNYAFAYVLTGDPYYAAKAREKIDLMRVNTEAGSSSVWYTVSSRQLSLTQGSLSAAMAYDFCYDAWDSAYRDEISLQLYEQGEQQMNVSGPGWNGADESNWWGIRYSGAGIAYLASDEAAAATRLVDVRAMMEQYFDAMFSTSPLSRGAVPEGMGYTLYPYGLIAPYLLADLQVHGFDYRTTIPGVSEMGVWPWFFALPLEWWTGSEYSPGMHPAWQDDNTRMNNSGGALGLAFALSPDRFQPGLKWLYDRYWGALGDQTYSYRRAGSIWAYLYYPEALAPENPTRLWGTHYFDAWDGMILFRNQVADASDILAGLRCRAHAIDRRIHNGPDMNGLRLWGLGNPWITGGGGNTRMDAQSTVVRKSALSANGGSNQGKGIPPGQVLGTFFVAGGSGWSVTEGGYGPTSYTPLDQQVEDHVRRLLVDYDSPAPGAAALAIVSDTSANGEMWRINTPEYNTIQLLADGFIITGPDGNQLHGFVHHPVNPTISSGYFDTGDKLRIGDPADYPSGQNGYNNRFIDIEAAGNTDFQVTLVLVPAGQSVPTVAETGGSGAFRTIEVGGRSYTPATSGFAVPDWHVDPAWTVEQAYAAYVADHGLSDQAHGTDDDLDGFANWLEFAMGSDPKDPSSPGRGFVSNETGGMRLTFFKARPEIPLRLQASTDLSAWSPLTDLPEGLPADTQTGTGSFFIPFPGSPGSSFHRVGTGD